MTTRAARISDRLASRGLYSHVRAAAKAHHVFDYELLGSGRSRSVVAARHALWRVLYEVAHLSYPQIAELFETTPDVMIKASVKTRDGAPRLVTERSVVEKIAAYVAHIGYGELAREIRAGAWRPSPEECSVARVP